MNFIGADRPRYYFAGLLVIAAQAGLYAQSSPDLGRQIADVMSQSP